MLRQDLDGRYITVAYALLTVCGGEAHVTVACAGHPPAIFVSDAGDPARLDAHGDLLGIWPEIRLVQVELRLAIGESLVLYTDGVTDQGPGAGRSPEHALRELRAEPSAGALADALREEAERWNAVPRDDVAIVAVRYVGSAVEGEAPERTEHEALTHDGNGRRPGAPHGRPPRSGGRGTPTRRPGLTVGRPRA